MPQKYHISRKGNVAPCGATKRACSLQQFVVNDVQAQRVAAQPAMNVAPTLPYNPPQQLPSLSQYDGFDVETVGGYEDYDGFGDTEEYPYYSITDTELKSVHLPDVLAAIHNCVRDDVPQELVEYAAAEGWSETGRWEVKVSRDYYGDSVSVVPADEAAFAGFVEQLQAKYAAEPGASDIDGALEYARGRGVQTAGLTPLQAVKAQLLSEYGEVAPEVGEATSLTSNRIKMDSVVIGDDERYAAAVPANMAGPENSVPVAGVVVKRGREYVLVDGYRRVKMLKDRQGAKRAETGNPRSQLTGKFLILS